MNSFNTRDLLNLGDQSYEIYNPIKLKQAASMPYSHKILLENLLRHEDGSVVTKADIEALLGQGDKNKDTQEISYYPARVLMQDFTGVPALVDLAAMREAMKKLGGNPAKINPLKPSELVIDHSVQVDQFGNDDALSLNTKIEFQRNKERYNFLKWGQKSFSNFKVVPPGAGIVHQVNIEYLARVIFNEEKNGKRIAYPDTVVGTDSHTTMVNGIGVLGWGVGGIEAEASMLGQPISMLIPRVVGFKLINQLPEGSTATDLVLTIVQMLREHGVVGKFVEFYGPGLDHLSTGDRCTIANMAPEYGATCGIFPIDQQVIDYLLLTGRPQQQIDLIEAYAKQTGLWRLDTQTLEFDENLSLDLTEVVPSLAGPKRPQDKIALTAIKNAFATDLPKVKNKDEKNTGSVHIHDKSYQVSDGLVVIAAITSCTNTSNPAVMIAAGLLAKKALEKGLQSKPWVKTSLAPGSRAVTEYLEKANLLESLNALGFNLVGYGCTTCIGNSGPLPVEVETCLDQNGLAAAAVLSGNRNFEGRIHPKVRLNYLASPPLVVAYALAGTMNFDPYQDPLAKNAAGEDIYLRDIWPTNHEISEIEHSALSRDQFVESYQSVYDGDANWQQLKAKDNLLFDWNDSTYIAHPPYFENIDQPLNKIEDIKGAHVLAFLGDSVTTDHISPAGSIQSESPAGQFLLEHDITAKDFNSYGARRGNHKIMMRGTFANIRLRNKLLNDVEGGYTRYFPSEKQLSIYDAAIQYKKAGVATIILAGKEYGCGSSRDWAAKGPMLQGVKAVIAESFERIHRSNLVGMGILPLQFLDGENAASLGLDGSETFDITQLENGAAKTVSIIAHQSSGTSITFKAKVRIDTPREIDYYRNGGILPYVVRQLAADKSA